MAVPSSKSDSTDVFRDSNEYGEFNNYNLNSNKSEVVPQDDFLDDNEEQSFLAPQVELLEREDDEEARHNNRYTVPPNSPVIPKRGRNHVAMTTQEEEEEEDPKYKCNADTIVFVIFMVSFFIWLVSMIYADLTHQKEEKTEGPRLVLTRMADVTFLDGRTVDTRGLPILLSKTDLTVHYFFYLY
ncbi:hypothetical protein J6590_081242 [Homalodisca vitripennis]|nr:hypothetical protein J6590_081242 [Homalodisca vitripennis]